MRDKNIAAAGVGLVDIRDVRVDSTLPKRERVIEYVRQIKDPYHFKCGEMNIFAKYPKNGVEIEDCLQGLV
ncbi:hypothetical protein FACS1894105_13860 [Clostridia bacterium]|nr:hypothetical protein FACS1894105_13860 [Clostridia bacterium]